MHNKEWLICLLTIELKFSGGQKILMDDKAATISSSGLVTWTPHLRLRVLGPTDFTYFPYDEHRFHFLISSWLPDSKLNFFLANDYESWKLMNPGTEWDLVSAQSRVGSVIHISFVLWKV